MMVALCATSAALAQNMPSGQLPHPAIVRIIAPERDGTSYGSGTLVAVNDTYGLGGYQLARSSRCCCADLGGLSQWISFGGNHS